MTDEIRVFVGCAANGEDMESQAVLEHTLRKHSSRPVEITWMQLSRDPRSPFYSDGGEGWQTQDWATPFSGFRWAVPELCKFQGRAIYTDSDVIFRADPAELWDQPMKEGKVVLAKGGRAAWRFCVSLWDCEASSEKIPPIHRLRLRTSHRDMTSRFRGAPFVQPFQGQWNYCDNEDFTAIGLAKAVHYTDMSTQPQLRHALPRLAAEGRQHWFNGQIRVHPRQEVVDLFEDALADALKEVSLERYRAPEFGEYTKANLARYIGRKAG